MQSKNNQKYFFSAWLICGLGAVYYSYEYLLRITPSVIEYSLRDHFSLSATSFGLLSATYYYAYVPMQLPVGVLLDRYGPRVLLTLACLICVIGTFLFANTQIFWIAAVGRFLVGFGSAFAFVGVLKLATIWLPEDKLAMVSGLAAALGTIGAMVGDNLLGLLLTEGGWVRTVNMTAYFGIGLTIILWFGIRDRQIYQQHAGTISNFKRSLVDLGIIMRNPQIWINGMIGCLVYLPTTVFAELWGISYLRVAHGMTLEMAGFANSILFLGFTVGAPLMGFLSDKIKRRKSPILIGALGSAIIMMILLYWPGLSFTVINILLFSLGVLYSSQCIVFAIGRELSPNEAAGTAMALTNMLVMLGAMFLQPLIGRLLDMSFKAHSSTQSIETFSVEKLQQLYTAVDYQFALTLIPLGIIIAALLTFFLKETFADASN